MAAELQNMFLAGTQGFVHMQPFDTAAGTLADAVLLLAEDNGRLVIFIHQTRSHNADYAGIPLLPGHHNGRQVVHIHTDKFSLGLGQNFLFDTLPLTVEHIQLHSQRFCFRLILGEQKFHTLAG